MRISANCFVISIRLVAALKGELVKYEALHFVHVGTSTNVATELRKKDKAEKQKKSEKEKRFLKVTDEHLDRDVYMAHICSYIHLC